jgi:polyphosphate kinase
MSSKRRDRDKRRPIRRRYNVQMIRDFLDHLMWEVRINHVESTSVAATGGCKVNMELADQLAKYLRKYRTNLRAGVSVRRDTPDQTDEQVQQALKIGSARRAEEHQKYIDALETLKPLFKEALWCAGQPNTITEIVAPVSKVLDGTFWTKGVGNE